MANSKTIHHYDDIISLSYPYKTNRKKMSITNRSAQFAPFSALTGYEQAIDETGRLTDKKKELSSEQMDMINDRLQIISSLLPSCPMVWVTYFVEDLKKDGGSYQKELCEIKKIDEYEHKLILKDKRIIFIEQIYSIEGDFFGE